MSRKPIPFVVAALGRRDDAEDQSAFSGMAGFPPEETAFRLRNIELQSGSFLEAGDTTAILIGNGLALKYDLETGEIVNFRGQDFLVKGIFKPYEGMYVNNSAIVPIDTVRRIALLPPEAVVLNVIPKDGADPEVLAASIGEENSDVKALSPGAAEEQASRGTIIFTAIVLGLGDNLPGGRRRRDREYHGDGHIRADQGDRPKESHRRVRPGDPDEIRHGSRSHWFHCGCLRAS